MSIVRFHPLRLSSIIAAGAMATGALYSSAAPACGPPPPQGDCATQITCVLGSPRLVAWPIIGDPDSDSGGIIPVEIPTRLYVSQEEPPEGWVCIPMLEAEVDVWLNCSDAGASTVFTGSTTTPASGSTFITVPVELDESELGDVVPGDCQVSGKSRVLMSDGAEIEVKCGPSIISWVEHADDGITPVIEASFQEEDGSDSNGHYTAVAFAPQRMRVRVRNHHGTEGFSGEITVVTENANHMGTVLTGAGGGTISLTETVTTSLSEGEGDDFVVQSDSDYTSDGCLELPDPQDSISPTATGPFTLEPGEETVIGFWTRTWPTCPDGSCSGMIYQITGSFEGGSTLSAYLAGSLMVVVPPDDGEDDEYECPDSGETTTVGGCTGGPVECPADSVKSSPVPAEIRAGLFFESDLLEARPAVVNMATEASVELLSQEIEEDLRDIHSGRINETLWLADGVVSEGELITLSSQFSVVVIDGDGEFEVSEVVVGSKHQPEDDEGILPPSSFIGLGRIEITTSPFTEITTQYQAGVWTILGGTRVPLEVVDYEMTADGAGFVAELTLLVPDADLDVIYLTHSLRGYAWHAYENVCDDVSDNDNDGLVDCDDEDCDGHPACDEEEETGDSGEPGDDFEEEPEDEVDDDPSDGLELGTTTPKSGGCGCSTAGGLGLGLLLPALIVLFRREEVA